MFFFIISHAIAIIHNYTLPWLWICGSQFIVRIVHSNIPLQVLLQSKHVVTEFMRSNWFEVFWVENAGAKCRLYKIGDYWLEY